MFKFNHFSVVIFVSFFLLPFTVSAGNYLDGALLRAEGGIKVYLINNNIKRWVSSLDVFDLNNFKWQDVEVVSEKEVMKIEEGEPIIVELALPTAIPISSTIPVPTVGVSPATLPPPSVQINDVLPSPDYVRADWIISDVTVNYGRVGQRIVFKYSQKTKDKIENFRLYEKKSSEEYFYKIAEFQEVPSTGCEDIDIDGEWMLTEAGQCGYWSAQRIVLPGGRGEMAYLPADNFSVGEYAYYVAGVDKDGLETSPSPEAKLIFLNPVSILNPLDDQPIAEVYPTFRWTVADGWPISSAADYFIMISENDNALSPVWAKQLKVSSGETEKEFEYDGLGLNPAEKYKVNIYGHYRESEHEPDYISIPFRTPEFRVIKRSVWTTVFNDFFAAIFNLFF